jgi:nitric oxide reductase subunit B
VAAATRPGTDYSYTNNWPPEPLVGNRVTANAVLWSVRSLIALLGGVGLLFAAFGRWSFRAPGAVALTPAQRVCGWFFFVMAVLFLLQMLVDAASQHYRADASSFVGLDLAQILPFNLARTWHLQLAIFWVATSFLAAGIFLAPMIGGREPRTQKWLAIGLLSALAIVVFGSLAGEFRRHSRLDSSLNTVRLRTPLSGIGTSAVSCPRVRHQCKRPSIVRLVRFRAEMNKNGGFDAASMASGSQSKH